jgi:hypothetical protein
VKVRFVRPATGTEQLTLGSAIGVIAATGLWLLAAGLSQIDAGWTRAVVSWLVEEVSFRGFARDVLTGGPVSGALFALLYLRED